MPVRENAPKKDESIKNSEPLIELGLTGAHYLKLKKDETKLKKDIATENTKIKNFVKGNKELFDVNGKHLEIEAPLGDGLNTVFVQLQTAESVSMVDDIIARVRKKLGAKADMFIMTQEVLQKNSLEAMFNQGLIEEQDLLDWTTTKETQRLIVKANKK